jgi:peptide/nickel transport system substrate-binding protein
MIYKKRFWYSYLFSSFFIFFVILFTTFLFSCKQPDEEREETLLSEEESIPVYGDRIILGSIADAKRLLPMLATDSASGAIAGLIHNGLVKYDKDIKIVGDLAESWDISDDGLIITFYLRRNVKWHDGKPFTAHDCLFTYKKMIDPNVATPYSQDFLRVKDAKILDDYTFQVIYKEPFAPALVSWGMGIIPKHLLEKEDLNTTDYSRHPIGTGPYKLKEWITGQRIVLEAFDDYFEGRPYIDQYITRIIPDRATMFLEIQRQGIDYMDLNPVRYTRQTDTPFFQENFRRFRYPSFGYTYMGYNLKDSKFSDKRIRQALTYAIDREGIIKGVLLGLGQVCTGPFPPESWAYNPDVRRYPFNPERAKRLLAEAGWEDHDGDGILDKDGIRFEFTLRTNQGNEEREKCAQIIQQNLKEVGIEVKINILEWQAFLHNFIDQRKFEAIILGWALSRDPDLYDIWHSSKTGPQEFNFVSYKNPDVDRLIIEGVRTFDVEERKRIYHSIHEILAEEQPYTFLYVADALPIIDKRFHGIKKAPIGIWYDFIKWYVPKALQRYTTPALTS